MILADSAESECVIMNQQNLWVGNKIEIKLDFLSSLITYLKKKYKPHYITILLFILFIKELPIFSWVHGWLE